MTDQARRMFYRWLESTTTTTAEILQRRPTLVQLIETATGDDLAAARHFLRVMDDELQARADLARFLGE